MSLWPLADFFHFLGSYFGLEYSHIMRQYPKRPRKDFREMKKYVEKIIDQQLDLEDLEVPFVKKSFYNTIRASNAPNQTLKKRTPRMGHSLESNRFYQLEKNLKGPKQQQELTNRRRRRSRDFRKSLKSKINFSKKFEDMIKSDILTKRLRASDNSESRGRPYVSEVFNTGRESSERRLTKTKSYSYLRNPVFLNQANNSLLRTPQIRRSSKAGKHGISMNKLRSSLPKVSESKGRHVC